ncbi:MAG: cryptochrome/photolyase family protein [Parvularculaceae bacterium]
MTAPDVVVWLRRDLRLADNPALAKAVETGGRVFSLYVLDEDDPSPLGGAQRWWLHHSLTTLGDAFASRRAPLTLRRGSPAKVVEAFAEEVGAGAVFWNRRYDAHGKAVDTALKERLKGKGLDVRSFNGSLLREPWEIETGSGGWYKVFTPYRRALQKAGPARETPFDAPDDIAGPRKYPPGDDLADWDLTPTKPDWAADFPDWWTPGEDGAHARLKAFLNGPVETYDDDRNRPDKEGTSRLSPHLAFGEISPLQIWRAGRAALEAGDAPEGHVMSFLSEIAWREFSYVLLHFNPEMAEEPLKPEFAKFPWSDDEDAFERWTTGRTGFPIVDAGMRQLWETGWMHNRVRMIVASFLVKNMMVHWRRGERWFWDTLVDADPASNAAGWQWVAGSGADAAPYFRIFNPVTQSQKFDPDGAYVRRFVPELRDLPAKHVHAPFDATDKVLAAAGVRLGRDYPAPMLDLKKTRAAALDAYDAVRNT